jgi:hypothetical protein
MKASKTTHSPTMTSHDRHSALLPVFLTTASTIPTVSLAASLEVAQWRQQLGGIGASLMTACGNKVMQSMFNHLETKLNKIVNVNNLKKG